MAERWLWWLYEIGWSPYRLSSYRRCVQLSSEGCLNSSFYMKSGRGAENTLMTRRLHLVCFGTGDKQQVWVLVPIVFWLSKFIQLSSIAYGRFEVLYWSWQAIRALLFIIWPRYPVDLWSISGMPQGVYYQSIGDIFSASKSVTPLNSLVPDICANWRTWTCCHSIYIELGHHISP